MRGPLLGPLAVRGVSARPRRVPILSGGEGWQLHLRSFLELPDLVASPRSKLDLRGIRPRNHAVRSFSSAYVTLDRRQWGNLSDLPLSLGAASPQGAGGAHLRDARECVEPVHLLRLPEITRDYPRLPENVSKPCAC